jgi:hypothetical protein
MDSKWLAICIVGFSAAMFAPLAVMEYSKSQCKIAYVQSGKTAEEITKICK